MKILGNLLFCVFFVCFVGVHLSALDPNDIEIVSSYFGEISNISDPAYKISVIDENGNFKVDEWKEMCRRVANHGASAIRMMPFWLEKKEDHIFSPFQFVEGKYDLEKWNYDYFIILGEMVDIANSYKLKVYFTLYDSAGMRRELQQYNPWNNNHQLTGDPRYTGPIIDLHKGRWERKIIQLFRGKSVGFECFNEPEFKADGVFSTYKRLKRWNIPDENIIIGLRFDWQEYSRLESLMDDKYGKGVWNERKRKIYSPIHKITIETLDKIKNDNEKVRFWLSVDGHHPKPGEGFAEFLGKLFEEYPSTPFRNRWAIEAMHKKSEDDFDSAKLVSEAIYKHTGKYPENYGKFPKPGEPEPVSCEECFKKLLEKIEKAYPGLLDRTLRELITELINQL